MTEAEWLASEDPAAMLQWLRGTQVARGFQVNRHDGSKYDGGPSDRKLRLFVAAGLRVVIPESPLVPTVEAMADNLAIPENRKWWPTIADVGSSARTLVNTQDPFARSMLAHLLRDIVGSPFRPVMIRSECDSCCGHGNHGPDDEDACPDCGGTGSDDCDWLTPTVLTIGQAAYDHRDEQTGHLDPVCLAILADALEEAGCDGCILAHLRGPGPHVRGCWAIDLLTGRE
jgi:hypothetical protein